MFSLLPQKKKLDFIHLGVPRSGSTWLGACLEEHPEILKSKDLFFWNETGASYKNKTMNFQKGFKWYFKQFKGSSRGKKLGEVGTRYFADPIALERIRDYDPTIPCLVSMRNPTDRFISDYKKNKDKHNLPSVTELVSNPDNSLINDGLYAKHVRSFQEYFSKDHLLVLISEHVHETPEEHIKKVFDFIGVDNTFVPSNLHVKINPVTTSTAVTDEEKKLIDDFYKPHNQELEEVLGIDLSVWNS